MPQAKKKPSRAIDDLLAEVQDIRDLVEKIEKRSMYLRPDGILKSAGKQLTAGILRGIGVLVGGIVFLIIFGVAVRQALSSEKVQSFIGAQIQEAVGGAIEQQIDSLPWR